MDAPDAEGAGGKRKFKENAFTAKAESGTLRVKILRKDQPPALGLALPAAERKPAQTASRRKAAPAPASPDSPPKPRPNRKHVPIFYQQKRRPRDASDALHSVSSSSSSVSGVSTDLSGSGVSASTSSTTGATFGSLLSGLQLDSSTGTPTTSVADLLPPPPSSNPLFSRTDSDGLGALSELLRPHFPSATGPSFPLSGTSSGILSGASLGLGTSKSSIAATSSALHQLASSSQQYQSALDALSTATIQSGSIDSQTTVPALSASSTTNTAGEGVRDYKFNPLSALQSAIDHAQQLSQTLATTNVTKNRLQRSASSSSSSPVASSSQFTAASTNSDSGIQRLLDDGSDEDALGLPPSAPPPFTLQNSLMGGGIDSLIQSAKSKLPEQDAIEPPPLGPPPPSRDLSLLLQNSTDGGEADLGPPPSAPPAFRIENSLIGGGIETQPTIADVNTHKFDWKFREAAGRLQRPSPPRDTSGGNPKAGLLKVLNEGGDSSTSNESSQESRRGTDEPEL